MESKSQVLDIEVEEKGSENPYFSGIDYYPFGMTMPGRRYSLSSKSYRYAFNGKEREDEIYGSGNAIDFGARIYDGRIGRWLSVDPLQKKYPSLSPYNFVVNSPIKNVEVDGNYWIEVNVCYAGSCPSNRKGHYGKQYNKISSAFIRVIKIDELKGVNLMASVPFAPEISWPGAISKLGLAANDNSISFGATDWMGVALNLVGMGVAKNADKLGKTLIDINRSVYSLSLEQFQEFKETDYYNLMIDKMAIEALEEQGVGSVEDGGLRVSSKWLDAKQKEFSKSLKDNPDQVPSGFGGIKESFKVNYLIEKELNKLMETEKNKAKKELDSKFKD